MKVNPPQVIHRTSKLAELNSGATFEYEGKFYLLVNESSQVLKMLPMSTTECLAVQLSNGFPIMLEGGTSVIKVDANVALKY